MANTDYTVRVGRNCDFSEFYERGCSLYAAGVGGVPLPYGTRPPGLPLVHYPYPRKVPNRLFRDDSRPLPLPSAGSKSLLRDSRGMFQSAQARSSLSAAGLPEWQQTFQGRSGGRFLSWAAVHLPARSQNLPQARLRRPRGKAPRRAEGKKHRGQPSSSLSDLRSKASPKPRFSEFSTEGMLRAQARARWH
jgi:hypothetical protein